MKRAVEVWLGDEARLLGTLHHDQQGSRQRAAFEYAPAWLDAEDRFSVDPSLQLVRGPQFHKGTSESVFHGAIADTEPDGWGKRVILRDYAKRRQEARRTGQAFEAQPLNQLDYLLAVDDESRLGALRLRDEHGTFQRARAPNGRTTPPLIELKALIGAAHAVETSSETLADLAYLRGRGTSLGGMRPKCSVVDDDHRLCLAKFPSVSDERAITKGEVLALRLARAAGVQAAEACLVASDGLPVALVRRFDRVARGGRLMLSGRFRVGAKSGASLG